MRYETHKSRNPSKLIRIYLFAHNLYIINIMWLQQNVLVVQHISVKIETIFHKEKVHNSVV